MMLKIKVFFAVLFALSFAHPNFSRATDFTALCSDLVLDQPVESKRSQLAPKVLIYSSEFGGGHKSAAEAARDAIQDFFPKAPAPTIKTIESLRSEFRNQLELKVYWTVVKHFPWLFDFSFAREMNSVTRAGTLDAGRQHINPDALVADIEREKPDVIIVAQQLAAKALARLKQQGKLKNIPVGFVHTDLFVGYFPEVSKHLEATFVADVNTAKAWIEAGVDPLKVKVSGMLIGQGVYEAGEKLSNRAKANLDPAVRTITISSGIEGVGDYPRIVNELVKAYPGEPLQIIAVCGNNKNHFKTLTRMAKKSFGNEIDLRVYQKLPRTELLHFIRASDLYITKSGGLSPAEGFELNLPIILLDVYGGHERKNSLAYEKLGVGLINRDYAELGAQARELLEGGEGVQRMLEAQRVFNRNIAPDKIAKFIEAAYQK